jgi:outer membrane receptor protein involved in Fe transport
MLAKRRRKAAWLLWTAALAAVAPARGALADADPQGPEAELPTITVTAQKRSEAMIQVPISGMALDQATMDREGIKDISDIARLVPGVTFQGSDDVGDMNIAIRGIISSVGAPTTGIYIDDVPVQVRQDSAVWSNPYPKIYDLDRVEVLRGPQGTLFGAGSEGGVVRFITPEASLTRLSGYASAELATTRGGAMSWEAGGVVGGPLDEGKAGLRASFWHRDDGGYADRLDPVTHAVLGENVNSSGSSVVHLNAKLAPLDGLTITPSLFYQEIHDADKGLFWESAGTYDLQSPIAQPHSDHFILPSLGVAYDFGGFSVKSISSYIDRIVNAVYDSTSYELSNLAPNGAITVPFDPDYLVAAYYHSTQQGFTQELRFTSTDAPGDRWSWVGGAFFQNSRFTYDPLYQDGNFNALANYLSIYYGYGPGNSLSYFGEAPIDGIYSYVDNFVASETDLAAFGNVTYAVTPAVKVAAGLRVSRSGYSYSDRQDGPWGPAAPFLQAGSQTQVPVTPRVNATWEFARDDMVYASVAKGYRIGGANEPVPGSCAADLAQLGLTAAPATYNSDSLWSYEVGMKGRLLDRRALVETSLFWIDWSQIQQAVNLVNCGYGFIGNLGTARSRGLDFQGEWALDRHLVLYGTTGLTDARFTTTLVQDGQILAKSGDRLATPAVTATAAAEYRFRAWADGDSFARLDYQFNGAYYRTGSAGVFGSDPLLRDAPSVRFLSARVGTKLGKWEASVYGNNLLNADTSLYRYRDNIESYGLRDERLRPMTIGVAAKVTFF